MNNIILNSYLHFITLTSVAVFVGDHRIGTVAKKNSHASTFNLYVCILSVFHSQNFARITPRADATESEISDIVPCGKDDQMQHCAYIKDLCSIYEQKTLGI